MILCTISTIFRHGGHVQSVILEYEQGGKLNTVHGNGKRMRDIVTVFIQEKEAGSVTEHLKVEAGAFI